MLHELENVIRYIDINDDFAKINRQRVERTGLSASYDYAEKREWFKDMKGAPVICWDDFEWKPISNRSQPVFCDSGTCLLGHAEKGVLYCRNKDRIIGKARINCSCGVGKSWNNPK